MIRTILAVVFFALFVLFGWPYLGVMWLYHKKHPKEAELSELRKVQAVFKIICFIAGVKLTVLGEENVPKDEPVMYVGNHRSYFDIIITYARCPGRTGYVSKAVLGKVWGLRTWMERLNCLFIERNDVKQNLQIILQSIENVKNGISMCIYPEGGRSKGEDELDMLPFKEGSFKISTKTGCKIVPMAITGTRDIFEKQFPRIKSGKVILEYGKPIDINDFDKEAQKHIGEYTQNQIMDMLKKHKEIMN